MKVLTDTVLGIVTVDGVQVYPTVPIPPPGPTPTGQYYPQWQMAVSLDHETQPGKGCYGYLSRTISGGNGDYPVPSGTSWFRINAATVGMITNFNLSVVDYAQSGQGYFGTVYPLDPDYNMLPSVPGIKGHAPYTLLLPGGQGGLRNMPARIMWLLKIDNPNAMLPLSIWYQ